jgi:hypothetical protein
VRRSAKQAAVPAPRHFTAVVGGISEGVSPTMVPVGSAWSLQGSVRSKEVAGLPGLQCREEAAGHRPEDDRAGAVWPYPISRHLATPGRG